MKITLEIEPEKDTTPLLGAMKRISHLLEEHQISGDATTASNQLVKNIFHELILVEGFCKNSPTKRASICHCGNPLCQIDFVRAQNEG